MSKVNGITTVPARRIAWVGPATKPGEPVQPIKAIGGQPGLDQYMDLQRATSKLILESTLTSNLEAATHKTSLEILKRMGPLKA